jgi:putative flippase GtrA
MRRIGKLLVRLGRTRVALLMGETVSFGTVGALAFVIDMGVANLLRFSAQWGPLTSKVIATVVAATFAYAANRCWTWRYRANSGLAREYVLFFLFNGIGLLITMLGVGFVSYTLGLNDPVSYNVALTTSTLAATLFRFWSYKRWVFLPPRQAPPQAEMFHANPRRSHDEGDDTVRGPTTVVAASDPAVWVAEHRAQAPRGAERREIGEA